MNRIKEYVLTFSQLEKIVLKAIIRYKEEKHYSERGLRKDFMENFAKELERDKK
jgi:hypothetical protein